MLYLCSRCGGVITENQTIHHDGEKHYHYYCDWKNWQERKEALLKGGDNILTARNSLAATPPKAVK